MDGMALLLELQWIGGGQPYDLPDGAEQVSYRLCELGTSEEFNSFGRVHKPHYPGVLGMLCGPGTDGVLCTAAKHCTGLWDKPQQ
jgi:hypothetical protein